MGKWERAQEEMRTRLGGMSLLFSQVREGVPTHHTGPHGEAQGWSGGRRGRRDGKAKAGPLVGASERKARHGRV